MNNYIKLKEICISRDYEYNVNYADKEVYCQGLYGFKVPQLYYSILYAYCDKDFNLNLFIQKYGIKTHFPLSENTILLNVGTKAKCCDNDVFDYKKGKHVSTCKCDAKAFDILGRLLHKLSKLAAKDIAKGLQFIDTLQYHNKRETNYISKL